MSNSHLPPKKPWAPKVPVFTDPNYWMTPKPVLIPCTPVPISTQFAVELMADFAALESQDITHILTLLDNFHEEELRAFIVNITKIRKGVQRQLDKINKPVIQSQKGEL